MPNVRRSSRATTASTASSTAREAVTVTATLVGLLPIMVGTGTGAEVTRRIAAPMVGGVLSLLPLALLLAGCRTTSVTSDGRPMPPKPKRMLHWRSTG